MNKIWKEEYYRRYFQFIFRNEHLDLPEEEMKNKIKEYFLNSIFLEMNAYIEQALSDPAFKEPHRVFIELNIIREKKEYKND